MFKFRPNVVLRFNLLVVFFFTLAGIIIIGKAAIIMFIERDDWNRIKEKTMQRKKSLQSPRKLNVLQLKPNFVKSLKQSFSKV